MANLPNDNEVKEWFKIWIGEGCSASSAIYKFRNWLKEREQKTTNKAEALPMLGVSKAKRSVNRSSNATAYNDGYAKGYEDAIQDKVRNG